MKVKELIKKLETLDQEKTIKVIVLDENGNEETDEEIHILEYEKTKYTNSSLQVIYPIKDDSKNKDFYIIR